MLKSMKLDETHGNFGDVSYVAPLFNRTSVKNISFRTVKWGEIGLAKFTARGFSLKKVSTENLRTRETDFFQGTSDPLKWLGCHF